MQKFAIFKKTNRFYWTKNRTIYSIFFICIAVLLINQKLLHINSNIIVMICGGGIAVMGLMALFWSVFGIAYPDSLKGELEGHIIFGNNVIKVGEESFPISTLKNIEIFNEDYYGKLIFRGRGDFNSTFSNGVENYILITLLSNEQKKYYYQLLNSNDFQNIRKELVEYYKQGKITFQNLCKVLGEESEKEIEDFKRELSK